MLLSWVLQMYILILPVVHCACCFSVCGAFQAIKIPQQADFCSCQGGFLNRGAQ